jgi:transcriptional regulator with XRE-family HTH domain
MCYLYNHVSGIARSRYENMDIELLKITTCWWNMEFKDQLRQLRESKNLTQAQVAEMIEIAKTTYIGYEKGEREPRLSELKKLAHLYGVTLSELCMEADARNIDQALALHFENVKQFDVDEMKTFSAIVESMVMRHNFKKAQEIGEKTKAWKTKERQTQK